MNKVHSYFFFQGIDMTIERSPRYACLAQPVPVARVPHSYSYLNISTYSLLYKAFRLSHRK